MSSVLESEEPGVTLISIVEDFGSDVECRHLHYCVTRFLFYASKDSEWILDYKLSSDTSESSYAYLIRLKDYGNDLIDLSGTFSIVTHDGVAHVLAIFLNHEFEKNTVKEIKLKKLDLIRCEEEELFSNGNLILRCHLWQKPVESRNFEYKVRYRSLIQKYKFPWLIKSKPGEEHFKTHPIIVQPDFKIGKNKVLFEMKLAFENFLKDEIKASLFIGAFKNYDFGVYISYSIFVRCVDGTLVYLSKIKNYCRLLNLRYSQFPLCISLEEFKNNGDFYYPNGILTLICHFKCIRNLDIEFESISLENNTTEAVAEGDVSNLGIIATPLEEDITLTHAMYSLYEEGKFCDLTLRSGTVKYPCHKAVLCSRSLVFNTMFESDMLERKNNIVDIADVNPRILSMFLKYIYTDRVDKLNFEDSLQLFSVADKYDVKPLQKKCLSILKTKITKENAMEILICADMHQNDELSTFSKNYICKHAKSFINSENWKDVKKNYPGLALEIQDQLIGKILL